MKFVNGVRPPHLADEDLLRHIDRQLDLEGSRRVRSHLARCEECSARVEQMKNESHEISTLLAEIPVRMPHPARRALALAAIERTRARRRFAPASGGAVLRVAAAVALLFLGSLTTQPVRAWVGDRVEGMVGPRPGAVGALLLDWLGRDEAAAPVVMAEVPTISAAPVARPVTEAARGGGEVRARVRAAPPPPPVTFVPEGPEVRVEFASLQAAGEARFTIRDVDAATARITDGSGGERMEPRDDGLVIRNHRGSRARYEVVVPSHYRLLRVRVAGGEETLIRISPSQQEWAWTIGLGQTAPQ